MAEMPKTYSLLWFRFNCEFFFVHFIALRRCYFICRLLPRQIDRYHSCWCSNMIILSKLKSTIAFLHIGRSGFSSIPSEDQFEYFVAAAIYLFSFCSFCTCFSTGWWFFFFVVYFSLKLEKAKIKINAEKHQQQTTTAIITAQVTITESRYIVEASVKCC